MALDELLCHIGSPLPFVPPGAVLRAPHAGGRVSTPTAPIAASLRATPPETHGRALRDGAPGLPTSPRGGEERAPSSSSPRASSSAPSSGSPPSSSAPSSGAPSWSPRPGPSSRPSCWPSATGFPPSVLRRSPRRGRVRSPPSPSRRAPCPCAAPRRAPTPGQSGCGERCREVRANSGGARGAEIRGGAKNKSRKCPTGPQPQCTPAARPRTAGGSAADRVNGRPPRGPPRPQGGSRERAKRATDAAGATPRSRRTRSGAPRRRSPRPTSTPRGRGPGPFVRGGRVNARGRRVRSAAGAGRGGAGAPPGSGGARWPLPTTAPGFGWPPTCSSGSAGGFPRFGGMAFPAFVPAGQCRILSELAGGVGGV